MPVYIRKRIKIDPILIIVDGYLNSSQFQIKQPQRGLPDHIALISNRTKKNLILNILNVASSGNTKAPQAKQVEEVVCSSRYATCNTIALIGCNGELLIQLIDSILTVLYLLLYLLLCLNVYYSIFIFIKCMKYSITESKNRSMLKVFIMFSNRRTIR